MLQKWYVCTMLQLQRRKQSFSFVRMILNRFTNYGCQYEYGYVCKLRPVGNGDMEWSLGERRRANKIIYLFDIRFEAVWRHIQHHN